MRKKHDHADGLLNVYRIHSSFKTKKNTLARRERNNDLGMDSEKETRYKKVFDNIHRSEIWESLKKVMLQLHL